MDMARCPPSFSPSRSLTRKVEGSAAQAGLINADNMSRQVLVSFLPSFPFRRSDDAVGSPKAIPGPAYAKLTVGQDANSQPLTRED